MSKKLIQIYKEIEEISTKLSEAIRTAASMKGWPNNILSSKPRDELSREEVEEAMYLTAKGTYFDEHYKSLVRKAVDLWTQYKNRTFDLLPYYPEDIEASLNILIELHNDKLYPKEIFLWGPDQPDSYREMILEKAIGQSYRFPYSDVCNALDIGYYMYEFLPNFSLPKLFLVHIPIVDPQKAENLRQDTKLVFTGWKIAHAWYSYVERRTEPEYQFWKFHEDLYKKLLP